MKCIIKDFKRKTFGCTATEGVGMLTRIVAGAVALGIIGAFAASASAADYEPAPAPEPLFRGGVYIGAFGGATWFNENNTDFDVGPFSGEASLDVDTGYILGGVLGYNWSGDFGGLRSEIEFS